MKITSITKEQEARFPEWVDKYVKIGLSTEPADFDKATKAALKAYELCGLNKPKLVLHMSSPYGATLGGIIGLEILRSIS